MHPYRSQPTHSFWSKSIAKTPPQEVDPVVAPKFTIDRETRISTAGSCFAQHIAHRLIASGFNYLITEPAHPLLPDAIAARFNYGNFTARFGNLYTSRQLLQLFDRAYGTFTPMENAWIEEDGTVIDPFRPQLTPGGYKSTEELEVEREGHFKAVRAMFEQADIFIFTLGLTETWTDRRDGAAYPVCPGTAAGTFDVDKHAFVNLDYEDVLADMSAFIERLKAVNPSVKLLLTVSPVPLVATATDNHVLVATTYSKSVLRAVADKLTRSHDDVFYFPSYEIITGNFNEGRYYQEDRREVRPVGVDHVMRLFFKHYCGIDADVPVAEGAKPSAIRDDVERLTQVLCDEEMLDS
ncbi:hypothetical protein J2W40_001215 [Sphingobium xenophagum]|uniref:GSCFA domain-containing protein n=1 Tax=Sphingobium xenophagum TaxID=121428 RepID=A0ABU1WYJ7_SPHXE|nr:GSCFA domain-containing protein [Sphingobium xenophagum]MDR7154403.1 hypothetical protein [Sphingobium xenophagum]